MRYVTMELGMKAVFMGSIVGLFWLLPLSLSSAAPANANVKGYDELIAKAASCAFRGIQASENELRAAEAAYNLLAKEKDVVTEWICSTLQTNPDKDPQIHGYVLWRFGPRYVESLEPSVLKSNRERTRINGVYIMGMGNKYHKSIVDLTVDVLRRDPSARVKAEAIHSLEGLRAADDFAVVIPYLDSKDPIVRKAAVQFFWSHPQDRMVKTLQQMLLTEKDAEIHEWIEKAIAQYQKNKDLLNE